MIEPIFLSLDKVLRIHDAQILAFGGSEGIRELSLLESAVMTPQASFGGEYLHQDIYQMAAAYAFHIAENQPFLDGNKRTALASAIVFLDLNDIIITDENGLLFNAMIDIAQKTIDKYDLAELFRSLH